MKKELILTLVLAGGFFLAQNVFSQESPKMDDNMMDSGMENMDAEMNLEDTGDNLDNEDLSFDDYDEDIVAEAEATIVSTNPDSQLNGFADLIETKEGVYVDAEFYSAPAGKHGFHIHQNGSCEDAGNAAGDHFNPDGVQHGYFPDDGAQKAHPGDLGNVEVDENGEAYFSVFLPGVSLSSGKYNVLGKAIILHEKEDDMGQPTGNAGGRIGCGVIEKIDY